MQLSFDEARSALLALEGQQVIMVISGPDWNRNMRPYRGPLRHVADRSTADAVQLVIEEPRDGRWTNPTGTGVLIVRDAFVSAERCGGPAGLGVSVLQGDLRASFYPCTEPGA